MHLCIKKNSHLNRYEEKKEFSHQISFTTKFPTNKNNKSF